MDKKPAQGFYLDGETPVWQAVDIGYKQGMLNFRIQDGRDDAAAEAISWPLGELRRANALSNQGAAYALRLNREGDAAREIAIIDQRILDALKQARPDLFRRQTIDADARAGLKWAACGAALLVALYFAWPPVADRLAKHLPAAVSNHVAAEEYEILAAQGRRCVAAPGQAVLDDIASRLAPGGIDGRPPQILVFDTLRGPPVVNAFALADGRIVLMNGLIQHIQTPDEIFGILAHEMGHIEGRHAARKFLRGFGVQLAAGLFGQKQLAEMLWLLSYNRDFEREADARGIARLERAGISPAAMTDLFADLEKLERQRNRGLKFTGLSSYLSSHPLTAEREAAAARAAADWHGPDKAIIGAADWESVRGMCGPSRPRLNLVAGGPASPAAGGSAPPAAGGSDPLTRQGTAYLTGRDVPEDDAKALQLLTRATDHGDPAAQNNLAYMYAQGIGVAQDDKRAFDLAHKAAAQGYAPAQANLGVAYLHGAGVAENDQAGFEWIAKAAAQGSVVAEIFLSALYDAGKGAPQDLAAGFQWMSKAAAAGDAKAENALGNLYAAGLGTPQDFAAAMQWSRKAAASGDPDAPWTVGYLYTHGQGVPRDEKAGFDWMAKSAALGSGAGEAGLGELYLRGIGVAADDRLAFAWESKGAAANDSGAQATLAALYLNGRGVAQDDRAAVRWLFKSGAQGDDHALSILGSLALTGRGIAQDDKIARTLLVEANSAAQLPEPVQAQAARLTQPGAADGPLLAVAALTGMARRQNPAAAFMLGEAYLTGMAGAKNPALALHYLTQAAAADQPDAERLLAALYATGNGVPADIEKAEALFDQERQHIEEVPALLRLRTQMAALSAGDASTAPAAPSSDAQNPAAAPAPAISPAIAPTIASPAPPAAAMPQEASAAPKNAQKNVQKNVPGAALRDGAMAGDAQAQYLYGMTCIAGKAAGCGRAEGLDWLTKSAGQTNVHAMALLGEAYSKGRFGLAADAKTGFGWTLKAAQQGDAAAQARAGLMFDEGAGTAKDPAQAFLWSKRSADQGNALGEAALGILYLKGDGVSFDQDLAARYLAEAAAQGNAQASRLLQQMEK